MNTNRTTLIWATIALVIGLGGGYLLPHSAAAAPGSASGPSAFRTGGFALRGGPNGASMLVGTIAKASTGSFTLTTRGGNSQVIIVTPDTTVMKSVMGTLSDVAVGSDVIVAGIVNSDGSVSAQSITLRPSGAPSYGSVNTNAGAAAQ